jgi:hypothetical protein
MVGYFLVKNQDKYMPYTYTVIPKEKNSREFIERFVYILSNNGQEIETSEGHFDPISTEFLAKQRINYLDSLVKEE